MKPTSGDVLRTTTSAAPMKPSPTRDRRGDRMGARWTLAVGSTDGTRGVNVVVHDSVDSVKSFFEEYAGAFGTTDYFEADAASAVGLPR
jgi:hypothetical protein